MRSGMLRLGLWVVRVMTVLMRVCIMTLWMRVVTNRRMVVGARRMRIDVTDGRIV